MLRRARELGPPVLVPLAWTFVVAAHLGVVAVRTLFIAHVVMSALLAVFAVTGRSDMRRGTLLVWWRLIVVGLFVTLCGTAGFLLEPVATPLQGIALFGWMLLPAVGFVDTGRRVPKGTWIYLGGAAACGLGAVAYAVGVAAATDSIAVAGLVAVGLGQTAGILDAAIRY
ncbi:hypothetical protein C491_08158 [Natronococcus amylolyticus DSM 10524]|uniref:Uncharacterized protein n=1 Tax=Natronococcus amylolyticus DSM 10524 TaxID=1227497 RepID=L9XAZ7_9EURY|nr:hypothetical protein [Natronococcus amylolyticus]ELY58895.1 hypothetical protein C491_08158 [Natronococcus amylolyticus DSM 10524]